MSTPLSKEYPELKEFRAKIDTLDLEISRLLMERLQVVQQVGELKAARGETHSYIRPDREARMLHNIVEHFEGKDFPTVAAVHIWRIIIGASIAAESPLELAVLTQHDHSYPFLLAREYFGPAIPCNTFTEQNDLFDYLQDHPHAIGIIPPDWQTEDTWWPESLLETNHRVFACLPCIETKQDAGKTPPVFAVGTMPPSPMQEDETLILAVGTGAISKEANLIANHGAKQLIALPGYFERSEELPTPLASAHILGSYTKPVRV
jgi:chorismate mutase